MDPFNTCNWTLGLDFTARIRDARIKLSSVDKSDKKDNAGRLKMKKGKDIWLIGGGEINTILLNNNLIDTIILTVFPLIPGRGIPLFPGGAVESRFELENCKSYKNGLVKLTYSRME